MNIDIKHLEQWVGRRESRQEQISPAPATGLAATLNRHHIDFSIGDVLPTPWHWLYFLPTARLLDVGTDGHPKLGGFLPPIPLPRRMWAAGSMQIIRPLRIGDSVTKESRIESIDVKEGRSGTLVFVKLSHELSTYDGIAIREIQDLVYRDSPTLDQQQPSGKIAATDEKWQLDVTPDPILLFRYSALTFNSHRIHYDRNYATQVEHYPALVVHSPLIATLLTELVYRSLPDKEISEFQFRATHPTFDTAAFSLCGKRGNAENELVLWSREASGTLTMDASAKIIGKTI
jgi:3-methylfumaryl-CoA hydratase